MSIELFAKQVFPELLLKTDASYLPEPSDLFAIVVMRRLTQEEIVLASKGFHAFSTKIEPSQQKQTTLEKPMAELSLQ